LDARGHDGRLVAPHTPGGGDGRGRDDLLDGLGDDSGGGRGAVYLGGRSDDLGGWSGDLRAGLGGRGGLLATPHGRGAFGRRRLGGGEAALDGGMGAQGGWV